MLLHGDAPPGRAPVAASPLALLTPTGPPPSERGGEPRGAIVVVELEVYIGPAPGG